ncbi:penicillin-binding transpeptidase domain-containing protein [Acaricomes phytoseiuli]|uniref:penicillin-binding transpeptidase domain-containing protein n=1 Tax=Acaricomes phytoseiuli TaxID=291968 RepID=UPI0022226812|nr:penicillin-binding transpeptidase domain-containing protein [Acaricomes phytoseiuli]MCW1250317.1 penicillin-binding transpeptidase domain-containing protein [Acaricomes phytoseiuli]
MKFTRRARRPSSQRTSGTVTKALSAALITGVLAMGLTACDTSETGARNAATELAEALSALDVSQLAFSGETDAAAADQKLKTLSNPFAPIQPTVTLEGVEQVDGSWNTVTATLGYEWPFEAGSWTYQTTARLVRLDSAEQSSGPVWGAVWSPELLVPGLSEGSTLQVSRTQGSRGEILGDGGEVIVAERPVVNVGIDKSALGDSSAEASARALAALVEIDPAGYAAQVAETGPQAFVQAIVLRDDQNRTVSDQQISAIPGAVAIPGELPLAPSRDFARATLGTVGEATAELVDASDGRLAAGDETGLGGLQQRYDELLAGETGISVTEIPAAGTQTGSPQVLFSTDPTAGQDLQTTLNVRIQNIAQSLLTEENTPSSLVAIRPSDGAVLAVANGPGSQGYNTALQGQYAPGSTSKIVTALALLRTGSTPDTLVQCPATINAGGTSFKNYPGYPESGLGQIPLSLAFANSCNTAFIGAASQISQEQFSEAAAALGVGVPAEIGLESFAGSVPTQVSEAERVAAMIGQGKVLASPLTMATVAASVGQGSLVQPQLVVDQTDQSGASASVSAVPSESASSASATAQASEQSSSEQAAPTVPLTAEEDAALKSLMGAVVSSGNAGSLNATRGAPVIAKTGTAEYGAANPPQTHAWLVAVQGDLAVAMFVENARGFASTQLSPLMQQFLTEVAAG